MSDMAEWLGHRDPRITLETCAHRRARVAQTGQTEPTLPLEFDALAAAA
ncbi:hypothetical protein AB0C52_36185 [Streptomyces sp. NPDC048717]